MSKTKATVSNVKRRFSNKQLMLISAVLTSIIIFGLVLSFILLQKPNKFSLNAAIIDQIGEKFPSNSTMAQEFNETSVSILEQAGFSVTYHRYETVKVNFFKELAKRDYGIIILRAHYAKRDSETEVDIFTSEEYRDGVYDYVSKGNYTWEPGKFYFAITPDFIKHLDGVFPKSIIIAMGCWSLKPGYEEMADAFIQKGATAYIGWTEEVDISHSDKETVRLLRMLLEEKMSIADAVGNVVPDWTFPPGSRMTFYPHTDIIGNLKISDLIEETKASSNLQGMIASFTLAPALCMTFTGLKRKILDLACQPL
ncbi:MAG: hypothetical protein QHH18_04760 [Candidatus Bathyarchaeota archaeon]|jgi:hypothetical protein|nr:hypothetical protein [Candidatus Bathyarchaeota archaeon A05DMB-5]MDH7557900.1 hypothetical protein [Candidatus Bathyarchaeota archaeon]